MRTCFYALFGCSLLLLSSSSLFAQIPAFPGAEGFGAISVGGRGGEVLFVDNLNDDGPGSLREACQSEGPRIVIFRTGGTILLDSPIVIRDPFITIAGQTAPGDGILVRNSSSNEEEPLSIQTNDVIIRGLRIRPGEHQNSGAFDAVNFLTADRLIFDHCSFSWASDEILSDRDSRDVTVQWCMISEALNCSTHPKGCHGKGFRMGGDNRGSDRISIIHNLFAHNDDRNPHNAGAGQVELINNVMYNHGWGPVVKDELGPTSTLVLGNYFKIGRDVRSRGYEIDNPATIHGNIEFYEDGNIEDDYGDFGSIDIINRLLPFQVQSPPFQANATVLSVFEAYDQVVDYVGATIPHRDPVDIRVINDVINNTGTWIDHQNDVGGWPDMDQGSPPADSDSDGMPNDWETANGLNPNNPNDGNGDLDGDGYTNIEEYINELFIPGSAPTGVDKNDPLPAGFALQQNYPNPFNPSTTIGYSLNQDSWVSITIYDLLGQEVIRLIDQFRSAGSQSAVWDGRDNLGRIVAGGLYVYTMRAGSFSETRKLVYLK